ncbi:TRAP transporter permease [Chloroflexota bacterium]
MSTQKTDTIEKETTERRLPKGLNRALSILCVLTSLLYLYTVYMGEIGQIIQRAPLLLTILVIVFITRPLSPRRALGYWFILDCLLALLSVAVCIYHATWDLWSFERLTAGATPVDLLFSTTLVLLVLEAARRAVGWPIAIVALLTILYVRFGAYMPGVLRHTGFEWSFIVNQLGLTPEGVWGLPMRVTANIVVVFVIFSAFLRAGGGSWFFIELPRALFGQVRGGPAKVAVVASGLFGTISGSTVTNVLTTGSFTIPLMKSMGFRPQMAGAVEAISSIGGQVMPPIMGACAFILAEVIGVSYWEVCVAAFLPALLFYISLFGAVDLEAAKVGLKGLPPSELPSVKKVLARGGHLLVPLLVLVFALAVARWTPQRAAFWTIASTIVVSMLNKESRIGPKKIIGALDSGIRMMPTVVLACASAGIVIGMLNTSGLGLTISSVLVRISGGSLVILLILVAMTAALLGTGLSTTACYLFLAFLCGPAMVEVGVPILAAHLFIFWYACLSQIIPPVCIAAFAAAPIAQARPYAIAAIALRLGIVIFIVPFFFVYNTSLILQGAPGEIALSMATAIVGAYCIAAMGEGYLLRAMGILDRALFGIAGFTLIYPNLTISAVGLGFMALGVLRQLQARRRGVAMELAKNDNKEGHPR